MREIWTKVKYHDIGPDGKPIEKWLFAHDEDNGCIITFYGEDGNLLFISRTGNKSEYITMVEAIQIHDQAYPNSQIESMTEQEIQKCKDETK